MSPTVRFPIVLPSPALRATIAGALRNDHERPAPMGGCRASAPLQYYSALERASHESSANENGHPSQRVWTRVVACVRREVEDVSRLRLNAQRALHEAGGAHRAAPAVGATAAGVHALPVIQTSGASPERERDGDVFLPSGNIS